MPSSDADQVKNDPFIAELFKDITKEQIISSRQHFQDENVRLSNDLYRLKKNFNTLISWVETEIKSAEASAVKQTDEHFKELFLGQKIAYERTLRQLTLLKITR